MPNMQLAKNLRTLRKQHHLNQTHLSSILNISRQAYSNYENSKRTPDLDSLIHLTTLYNITLDQLVNKNIGEAVDDDSAHHFPAIDTVTKHTLYLTDDETELVMKYRDLLPNSKKVLVGFLESQVK